MGGKSKQTQRTKNNARPSNSGRSAELLGSTASTFVGFSAVGDYGMMPLAPGFATMDTLPDVFDSNITPELQLIMRKMSKKDPVTKVKALQEFQALLTESDNETIKSILPLWPKFYQNLANDVEHRVRETAQQTQSTVATKAGKSIAPFLKQLAPVWIASQFDSYAPAGSIAAASFKSSFSANKIQEVLSFCQVEILDFVIKNLTFHSASTLNSTKLCSPEDAENKYLRIVFGSLKTCALCVEHNLATKQNAEAYEKYQTLLENPKFWSISKHKSAPIRSAWFELASTILQNSPDILDGNHRNQMIQVCFQNMDDTDPMTSPHIWGCILLIETVFADWHTVVNFKKTIKPKFNILFKNIFNGSATVIGPNLLPFLAKLSDIDMKDLELYEFYTELFDNIKNSIISVELSPNASKSDIISLTGAFYECLRYVFKKINTENEENNSVHVMVATEYLDKYIISIFKWCLNIDHIVTKHIYRHCSALISYWSNNSNSKFYTDILMKFWSDFSIVITENVSLDKINETNITQILELIQSLWIATPSLHDNKVKFCKETNKSDTMEKFKKPTVYIRNELNDVVITLVRLYLERTSIENSNKYAKQLKWICDKFGSVEFYQNISKDKNLLSTLTTFKKYINDIYQPPEEIIDIIFNIISKFTVDEQLNQLRALLQVANPKIQEWTLERVLSFPLCSESIIQTLMCEKHAAELMIKIARDVVKEDSKDKLNLLHKCFWFQFGSGHILINKETVQGIIEIMSTPLTKNNDGLEHMIETCGTFIAQIMPVICSNEEVATKDFQNDVFLKLFKFTIYNKESDYLSEDTLWELTTCWQDALSSNDISMDDKLLMKCTQIINERIENSTCDLSIIDLNNIADIVAKLILCCTENIDDEEDRYQMIDKNCLTLLDVNSNEKSLYNTIKCLSAIFECMNKAITVNELDSNGCKKMLSNDLKIYYRNIYLRFSTIFTLTCNIRDENKLQMIKSTSSEDDQEYTEDYCDPKENILKTWSTDIYNIITNSMNVAAIGESIIVNSSVFDDELVNIVVSLSEKIRLMINNTTEDRLEFLKELIIEKCLLNGDVSWIRTLPFLLLIKPYNQYEENASILLFEDISDKFLEKDNQLGYLNFVQILVSKLSVKALTISDSMLQPNVSIGIRSAYLRCLICNHLGGESNEIADKNLIAQCISFIGEIGEMQQIDKDRFLYNDDISKQDCDKVTDVVEFMKLLTEALHRFPTEFTIKNWDSIRIGLCSWVLSISKSIENISDLKVHMFVSACYQLFGALSKFIKNEKSKTSTVFISNIIDEWENLFSREVNVVLFKNFYTLASVNDNSSSSHTVLLELLEAVGPTIEYIDFGILFNACKSGFKINVNDLIIFGLENLSNVKSVRTASLYLLKQLSQQFIQADLETLDKRNEQLDQNSEESSSDWHYLNKFSTHLEDYNRHIEPFLDDFSYKLTELGNLKPVDRKYGLAYLHIWDCIIDICSKSPAELRSIYAAWITGHRYEQILLNFLFRAMPIEILRNHDLKTMNNDFFKTINWTQICDDTISVERYACHMYAQMLRHLPAVARKWWSSANARQKLFVDKLTTNFVSSLIWQEDLQAINKKDKHENMQVTVHSSTREVIAVYSIDEARMELIITLAQNHPLGAVKVESGKQIGGKASSRNIGMQLTIFLTHQNGSIFDGLSLWKKNLDKKFSGVEECYVCYTVIHQDTCQLPKLTCKTCKKKFHGQCLYKWFTTSSKSTCPLCRNIF